MSVTSRDGSYRDVVRLPGAAPIFGAALVGRLSYGLLPLSVLFTVQQGTGSFATAGYTLAVFGLCSLSLPRKARLVDRYGVGRVLPPLAALTALFLSLLAFLPGLAVLWGLLAGLAAPPLGPSMRLLWSRLTEDSGLKARAYSLDAIAEETLYLIGPVLVGVSLGVAPARYALLGTAALMLLGTLAMVFFTGSVARTAVVEVDTPTRTRSALRIPGVLGLVLVVAGIAAASSLAYTGVAARSSAAGRPEAAGWIEAALAAGSVLGGLAWGRREHRRGRTAQLAGLVLVLGVGFGLAGLAPGLVLLGAAMLVAGLAVSPLLVVAYVGTDDLTPPERRAEASTWVNTGFNVGSAAGAAVAGVLVDRVGPGGGFAVAVLLLFVTALSLAGRRS